MLPEKNLIKKRLDVTKVSFGGWTKELMKDGFSRKRTVFNPIFYKVKLSTNSHGFRRVSSKIKGMAKDIIIDGE